MITRFVTTVAIAGLILGLAVPAQAVPGLSVQTVVSAASSAGTQLISASCPAGKRVVGGGGIVDGADGNAAITSLRPLTDRFEVVAVETDNGYAGSWWLRAFAICADPVPGLQIVASTSASSSLSSRSHGAACPAGTRVLGAGGRVNNAGGQVALQAVSTNVPMASQATVAGREDVDGYTGTWSLTSYAICANPVAGFSIATGFSAWDSSSAKLATATCPAGQKAHGPLYSIGAPKGDVVLETLMPGGSMDSVTVVAREETGTTESWSVSALAICAT
jgi:hypothetical protein